MGHLTTLITCWLHHWKQQGDKETEKEPKIYVNVIKRTGILWYRRNLNKAKFYARREKITLITKENVLLKGEGMVC